MNFNFWGLRRRPELEEEDGELVYQFFRTVEIYDDGLIWCSMYITD